MEKTYRIKKVTRTDDTIRYYPQKRLFGFWVALNFDFPFDLFSYYHEDEWWETYVSANNQILEHIKWKKNINSNKIKNVEYLDCKY